jgi:hypothetical protein
VRRQSYRPFGENGRLQREAASLAWGTNEAEIFGQARRFRVALTWALEIVTYGRSGMLVGCVGTGELKLQGSKKERLVKLVSPIPWHLAESRLAFKNLQRALTGNFVIKLTALRRV